jgi:hypothetical protein
MNLLSTLNLLLLTRCYPELDRNNDHDNLISSLQSPRFILPSTYLTQCPQSAKYTLPFILQWSSCLDAERSMDSSLVLSNRLHRIDNCTVPLRCTCHQQPTHIRVQHIFNRCSCHFAPLTMTFIGSGSTYVGSMAGSMYEAVGNPSRGGSQSTLVADDTSNLPPTKFALYVCPDFSEAAPRKVWTKWASGHRKIQYPGGVCLQADMFIRTNLNPTDPSAHAASGYRTCMQHVKTNLLTRIQCHFDEAFNNEDKLDDSSINAPNTET